MRPIHLDFMDSSMRALWARMRASDLRGYQLHGGTALALYLNHRASTDFDFFRVDGGAVRRCDIAQWSWLRGAQFRGSEGMVHVLAKEGLRSVAMNFVSLTDFNGINPAYPPLPAANGVLVGHPVDVLAGKLAALSNRGSVRDFWDIATAYVKISECLAEAASLYLSDAMTSESTALELAKTLLTFSFEVEHELPQVHLDSLERLARGLTDGTVPVSRPERDEGGGLGPKP